MRMILPFIIAISLLGCSGAHSAKKEAKGDVWNANSKKILIIQDNGYVPQGERRYEKYSITKASVSHETLQELNKLHPTQENLLCMSDGVTYKVIVTDLNNDTNTFVSSNRNCGGSDEVQFIDTLQLKKLLEAIKKSEK